MRATVLAAKKAKVTLGIRKIVGIGNWSLPGFTTEMIDDIEFEDQFTHVEPGIGSYGTLTFNGNYDPTDHHGQAELYTAWKNKTKITDIRLYLKDSEQYWTPDLAADAESGVYIETFGAITFDKADLGKIDFTARVTGLLKLVGVTTKTTTTSTSTTASTTSTASSTSTTETV